MSLSSMRIRSGFTIRRTMEALRPSLTDHPLWSEHNLHGIGDIDGLGRLDVVVCFEASPIGYLQIFSQEQNFAKLIDPEQTYFIPNSVGVDDFDLDGKNDVVVVSSSSTVSYLSVYRNDLDFLMDTFPITRDGEGDALLHRRFRPECGSGRGHRGPVNRNVSVWFNNNTDYAGYSAGNWDEGGRIQLDMPVSISSAQVVSGNPTLLVSERVLPPQK